MFVVPVSRSSHVSRSFDRLFDDTFERFFGHAPTAAPAARSPALDVAESDGHYTVHVEMPGVSKNDVKVSIDGRRVNIEATSAKSDDTAEKPEKPESAADQGGDRSDRIVYRERSVSSFSRSFTLPVELDQGESGAKLADGVLTLTLAKRRAASAARLTVN